MAARILLLGAACQLLAAQAPATLEFNPGRISRVLLPARRRAAAESAAQDAGEAAFEMETPIFISMLVIISACLPLFTPMAFTVCAALGGALLIAMTLTPVLATFFFRNGARVWENPLIAHLAAPYRRTLEAVLPRAKIVVAATAAVVAGAVFAAWNMGTEFLPVPGESTVRVRLNLPPGTSLEKSARVAGLVRQGVRRMPEVRDVASQAGRSDTGTDLLGLNRIEFLVTLKPCDAWLKGRTKALLVEDLARLMKEQVPGAAASRARTCGGR